MGKIITKGISFYDLCANYYIKLILKKANRKRFFASAEAAEAELERKLADQEDDADFPVGSDLKTFASRKVFHGSPLYRFSPENKSGKTILYLHGGGFVNQPDPRHFKAVDKLCAASGAEVFMPIYPKAPAHDFRQTYELIDALYAEILKTRDSRDVVFMGDSAGAMLCVTLCGEYAKNGVPLPGRLILYSLVADTALSNPEIAKIYPRDPMQGVDGLRLYLKAWAGGEPIDSPLINPMAVDLSVLPKTLIVSGTNEIFSPDVRIFAEKAIAAGADVSCYFFKHMYHCFPLFDLLAAGTVRKLACEMLT